MRFKFIKTGAVCIAACALMGASALAVSQGAGTVDASALNLRSSANTDASVLTIAPRGANVIISDTGTADGWYRVWYRGYLGYMSSEFVSVSDTLDSTFGTGKINGTTVRMRSGAGTDYSVLGTYDTGTEVSVIGVSGAWYKVSVGGTEGYIRSDFVSLSSSSAASTTTGGTSTSTTATASSTVGQKIVDTGMKYLGTPYVWAGTSPSGFDCSGFVYYVYKECGYSTSRTAASLFTNGDYVERDNLQAGDIICFTSGSGSYIGHCGIYIGDGKFVHASSGNGSVIVSSLSETYYNTHYYGARRVAY